MKTFKRISLGTALIALITAFTFSTAHAQVQEAPQPETYTLKGQVVNAQTTNVVADAQVTIVAKDISAMTDQEGKFKLESLPGGTYTLKVEVEGYQTWEKDLTLEKDTELTIKLKPNPEQ